jgi:hypothetical protein
MKTKGIVLMTFGKPAYAKMAYNMAVSIKHYTPDMTIALIHDDSLNGLRPHERGIFEVLIRIEPNDLFDNYGDKKLQKMNPGKAKTRIYNYLPFDYNLYLDVDGCALQSLDPLMDRCIGNGSYYLSQIVGWHTIDQGRDFKEMQWAWADDIWKKYGLLETDRMPAINSSFSFIRKCDEAANLCALIDAGMSDPITNLRTPWGATQPDELYTNIALCQMETKCDVGGHPVFFATRVVSDWANIKREHYVLGVFGGLGFSHSSVLKMYDRLMHSYQAARGMEHSYKAHILMRDKHANKRAPMS